MNRVFMVLLGALVAIGATLVAPVAANAAPSSHVSAQAETSPSPDIDPATLEAAYEELVVSDFPRASSVVDGQLVTTFTLPEGIEMAFATPARTGVHPNLSGGVDARGA